VIIVSESSGQGDAAPAAPLRVSITFGLRPERGAQSPIGDPCVGVCPIFGSPPDTLSPQQNSAETQYFWRHIPLGLCSFWAVTSRYFLATTKFSRDPISLEIHYFGSLVILGHRQILHCHNKFQHRSNILRDPLLWISAILGSLPDTSLRQPLGLDLMHCFYSIEEQAKTSSGKLF